MKFILRNTFQLANKLALCLFLFFYSLLGFTNTTPISFRELLKNALQNSPEFRTYEINLNIVQLNENIAGHYLLPTLDLNATHGLVGHNPSNYQDPWSSNFGLTLNENLYDNGRSYKNLKILKLQKRITETQFLQNKNKFCLNLYSEYLQYSLNRKLYEIQEVQTANIKKQFAYFSNAFYNGTKTQKDYLRLKTAVNRSAIDLLVYKKNILKSYEQLLLLSGETLTQIQFSDLDNLANLKILPFNFTDLPPQLLDSANSKVELPYLSIFDMQKQLSELQEDLVMSPYWPEINLSANAKYSNVDYWNNASHLSWNNTGSQSWGAFLNLNWNLLDWGKQSNLKEISIQTKNLSIYQIENQKNQYQSDLNDLFTQNQTSIQNFKLAQELLKMEESNISYIEREYRNGKVLYLDYSSGLRDFADAQSKYYSSVTDLLTTINTVKYHRGILFNELTQ